MGSWLPSVGRRRSTRHRQAAGLDAGAPGGNAARLSLAPCRLAIWMLLVLLGGWRIPAADPELRPEDLPHFPPVEPAQALGTFEVRPGFRLELAANEPEVMDPIALSFDEHGRVYVVEMRDYSERRPERLGRIRRLEDRDGDGRFETSQVFLEGLPWPTAVTCWDGGIFVGATPDLLYAKDTDGDGRADLRETLFTGFASDFAPYATNKLNVQAMMNSLQWGLDGRIHGCGSMSGGKIRPIDSPFTRAWRLAAGAPPPRPNDPETVLDLRGRDFSFHPRTLDLRAETGGGQYGMCFDDTGRKFLCSNSDHLQVARYEDRQAARSPWYALPPARASIAADGPAAEVFRISPEEPWRVIRTRWRVTGLVPGLIEGGGRASGYFTSATGLTIFRGDAYGPEFAGDAFVADCGSNLIHRKKLRAVGVDLVGERPPDERRREFLACRDTWFRPVQFANAPDGCLWMIDMYREIIEHPWSLPPNLKRLLDLNAGNDRGRLYRIVREGAPVRYRTSLAGATPGELVHALGHPNGWHRDTASRLLCERRDPVVPALLRETLHAAPNPLARLHALYVLAEVDRLADADFSAALADASPDVRRHAVRLLDLSRPDQDLPQTLADGLTAAAGGSAEVRLQLAFALGTLRHPRRMELLAQLVQSAERRPGESLVAAAALSAAGEEVASLFRALARSGPDTAPAATLAELAEIVGRRNRPDEVRDALERVSLLPPGPAALRVATRLGDGLRRAGATLAAADSTDRLAPLKQWARQAATRAGPTAPAAVGREATAQRDAIEFLGQLPIDQTRSSLVEVLRPEAAPEVQRAAAEALLRADDSAARQGLLARWPALGPEGRAVSLELLLRRPAGAAAVLDAVKTRRVAPGDLSAAQLTALRTHADAGLRQRAIELLGAPAASRHEAVALALPALDRRGDADAGRVIHQVQCAPCHRLGGEGYGLGPDLESVRSQPKEKLLVAIVDPNREVQPAFLASTVETTDDEAYTGLITADTAAGLTVKQASGVETQVPRAQIREIRAEGRSMMPEGFEATLSLQQLADLLALLTGQP